MDVGWLQLPLEKLPDPLPAPTVRRPFSVEVTPPGSKSLTNRALLLAALAEGESVLRGALTDAEDARVMARALGQLGAHVEQVDENETRVLGVGGRWRVGPEGVTINLENAGTATRFLAAAAMLSPPGSGGVVIDGNARMRERPIGELVDLLRSMGVRVEYVSREGFPPVRVHPPASLAELRSELEVGETASSQFVSALLLVGPFLPRGLELKFTGEVTSRSYVEMTIGLLCELGVRAEAFKHGCGAADAEQTDDARARVWPTKLFRFDYDVEPDASGATYFWAAAAMTPGSSCSIPGLGGQSLQGDAKFVDILERMGARVDRTIDWARVYAPTESLDPVCVGMDQMPDAAMTVAAACCFASGRSALFGLKTLRVKETDRIAALVNELTKVGVEAKVIQTTAYTPTSTRADEALAVIAPLGGIDCSASAPRVEFDTYNDHRMAMSLALIGLRRPNVWIRNPACVAKTYPTFWRDLSRLFVGG